MSLNPSQQNIETSCYFKKSKIVYRYSAYTFLWVILYPQFNKVISLPALLDALFTVVPMLALYIITPLGIFYSVKSYKAKEPYNKYRAFYLFGHLFFLFILLMMLFWLASDIVRYGGF